MKLYLSSFRLGDRKEELVAMASGRRLGFIPNALDHVEPVARRRSNRQASDEVRGLGLAVETLALTEYFGRRDELDTELSRLGGVWVRGGNTFVLRQAMRLSGFDDLLGARVATDFLYAGYSAGVCVLAPSLDGLQHVDDPTIHPYPASETVWEGLAILDYLILPHFQSDHHESAAIDQEVRYCTEKGIPFRTLRDGEVIILNDHTPP